MEIINLDYNNKHHIEAVKKLAKMNDYYANNIFLEFTKSHPLHTSHVKHNGKSTKGFLLKNKNKKLIGFVILQDNKFKSLNLKYILIHKKERGKGYGSKLIIKSLKYAKKNNFDIINAWVEYDVNVIKFYDKHQFLTYEYTKSKGYMYFCNKNLFNHHMLMTYFVDDKYFKHFCDGKRKIKF